MQEQEKKGKWTERYEVGLMVISIALILALVVALTLFPEEGKAAAAGVMAFLTQTFGSPMMLIAFGVIVFLICICFMKYGEIRFGNEKPQ